jgi:hypothetical protein
MKTCKKCNEEMRRVGSSQNGFYYKCSKCNEIEIGISNLEFDFGTNDNNELDYISDRGRD